MNSITVIRVEPLKAPELITIDSTLEALQKEVGGYIEAVYPFEDPVAIICNEEGKLEGLHLNRALRDEDGHVYDIIAGTFLIVGLGEENFTDIGEFKEKYIKLFEKIEMWLR